MDTIINQCSQRPAVSCNRIALNRCIKTEARWDRNPVSLDSSVTEINRDFLANLI